MAVATQDALTAARFSITIDGYEIASFSELPVMASSPELPTVAPKSSLAPCGRRASCM